jgi:tetratricopeptide (TPR) repeat protein
MIAAATLARSSRALAFFVGLVALIAFGGPAAAQTAAHGRPGLKPAARARLQTGMKLYEQGHYDEAIAELREGLAIDPQPDILYALGQAERKKGDCGHAIEHYQSCLALVNDPAAAAAIKVQIERCQVSSGTREPFEVEPWPKDSATGKPATPDAAALTPTAAATATPRAAASDRSWARDPLGASAVALGLGGIVAGGVLVGLAKARLDVSGDSYQQYSDARGWPGVWVGGIVSLSVGGALVALGIVRYAVVAHRAHRSEP